MTLSRREIARILRKGGYRGTCSQCGKRRIVYDESESSPSRQYCAECIESKGAVLCYTCDHVVWDIDKEWPECPMCGETVEVVEEDVSHKC